MTDIPHADLLADIRAFCAARGIKDTQFGADALNDTAFVRGLQHGRQCLPKTVARVRAHMAKIREQETQGNAA